MRRISRKMIVVLAELFRDNSLFRPSQLACLVRWVFNWCWVLRVSLWVMLVYFRMISFSIASCLGTALGFALDKVVAGVLSSYWFLPRCALGASQSL